MAQAGFEEAVIPKVEQAVIASAATVITNR
jgi:hypothetical protein